MNYVEHLNFLGKEVKENPCIVDEGEPTTSTQALVGCLYMDKLTGNIYKCVAIKNDSYTWESAESKPVKGVDYFTEKEISEIVEQVYSKIADGDEVSY